MGVDENAARGRRQCFAHQGTSGMLPELFRTIPETTARRAIASMAVGRFGAGDGLLGSPLRNDLRFPLMVQFQQWTGPCRSEPWTCQQDEDAEESTHEEMY